MDDRIAPSIVNLPPELCIRIVNTLLAARKGSRGWTTNSSHPNELEIDWNPLGDGRKDILMLMYATARKPGPNSVQPSITELCIDLLWNKTRLGTPEQLAALNNGIAKPAFGAYEPRKRVKPMFNFFGSLVGLFFGQPPKKTPKALPVPLTAPKNTMFDYQSRITHLRIDKAWPKQQAVHIFPSGQRVTSYEPGPYEQQSLHSLLRQLRNLEHLTLGYTVILREAEDLFAILNTINGGSLEGRLKMRGLEVLDSEMSPAQPTGVDQVARVWEELFTILPNLTTVWFPHWSPPDDPAVLLRALERKWSSGEGHGIEKMYIILNGYKPEDILKVTKMVAAAGEHSMPALVAPGDSAVSRGKRPRGELEEFVLYARPRPGSTVLDGADWTIGEVAKSMCNDSRALEHLSCHTTLPFHISPSDIQRAHRLPKLTITGSSSDSRTPQIPDVLGFFSFAANFQVEELYLRYINADPSSIDLDKLNKTDRANLRALIPLRVFSCLGGLWFAPSHLPSNISQPAYAPNDLDYPGPPIPPIRVDCPPAFFSWAIHLSMETIELVEIVDNMGCESYDSPETYMWSEPVTEQVMGCISRRIRGDSTRPLRIRVGSYGFQIDQLERIVRFVIAEANRVGPGARAAIRVDLDVQVWPWDLKREVALALRIIKYRRLLNQRGIKVDNVFATFSQIPENVVAELFRLTLGGDGMDALALWREFAEAWSMVEGRGGEIQSVG